MALRDLAISVAYNIIRDPLIQTNTEVDRLKSNAVGLGNEIAAAGNKFSKIKAAAVPSMSATATATATATTGFKGLKAELFGSQQALERTSKALEQMKWGLAGAFGALTLAVGKSVRTFAGFESGLDRVGALTSATQAQMKLLSDTALQLGAKTVFSAQQATEGMQYLAMAGFNVNEIVAAMPGVLDAAAAGQVDLAESADITTGILRGFRLEADQAGRVADVLTATFTRSNTTMSSLGLTMKYAAPIAAGIGFQIEEVAAAAGLLGNAGIKGEMAGTTLRATLLRLSAPTGKAAKMLNSLGVTITDAAGKTRPLYEIFGQLARATAKMGVEQRAAALKTIFGEEALSGVMALITAGPDKLEKFTKELEASGGTAQRIAEKQLDNLAGSWEQLSGSIETAAIIIGGKFAPVLRLIADMVTAVTNVFTALPAPVQTVAAVLIGLSVAVLGVGTAAAFILPKYIALRKAIEASPALSKLASAAYLKLGKAMRLFGIQSNIAFGKFLLIGAGIAFVVLAIQDLITYIRGGDSVIGRTIARVTPLVQKVTGFMREHIAVVRVAAGVLGFLFGPALIRAAGIMIKNFALGIWRGTIGVLKFTRSLITTSFRVIAFGAKLLWAGLKAIAPFVVKLGLAIAKTALFGLKLYWAGIKAVAVFVKNLVVAAATAIPSMIAGLGSAIASGTAFNAVLFACPLTWIIGAIVALGTGIYFLIRNWDRVTAAVGRAWNSLKQWAQGKTFLGGPIGAVLTLIGHWNQVTGAVGRAWAAVKNWGSNLINTILEPFRNLDIAQTIINAILAVPKRIKGALSSLAQTIRDFLPFSPAKIGPLADLDKVGPGLAETVSSGLLGSVGTIKTAVDKFFDVVPNALEYGRQATVRMMEAMLYGGGAEPAMAGAGAVGGATYGRGGGLTFAPQITINVTLQGADAGTAEGARKAGGVIADQVRETVFDLFRQIYHGAVVRNPEE